MSIIRKFMFTIEKAVGWRSGHHTYGRGKEEKVLPWTQWSPKDCIILSYFTLVNVMLSKANRDFLEKKYDELNQSKIKTYLEHFKNSIIFNSRNFN